MASAQVRALHRQSRYDVAVALAQKALAVAEHAAWHDRSFVARSLNDLAALHATCGRYELAEPLYERALVLRERHCGEMHPEVAQSLNNLALLRAMQGRYSAAEALYLRALEIQERTLGLDHGELANTLNNLAVLLKTRGELPRAKALYRRALAIREQACGGDSPEVAMSLHTLAALLAAEGDHVEAEALCRRSLSIREAAFGPDHPDVAMSLNVLAMVCAGQARAAEAKRAPRSRACHSRAGAWPRASRRRAKPSQLRRVAPGSGPARRGRGDVRTRARGPREDASARTTPWWPPRSKPSLASAAARPVRPRRPRSISARCASGRCSGEPGPFGSVPEDKQNEEVRRATYNAFAGPQQSHHVRADDGVVGARRRSAGAACRAGIDRLEAARSQCGPAGRGVGAGPARAAADVAQAGQVAARHAADGDRDLRRDDPPAERQHAGAGAEEHAGHQHAGGRRRHGRRAGRQRHDPRLQRAQGHLHRRRARLRQLCARSVQPRGRRDHQGTFVIPRRPRLDRRRDQPRHQAGATRELHRRAPSAAAPMRTSESPSTSTRRSTRSTRAWRIRRCESTPSASMPTRRGATTSTTSASASRRRSRSASAGRPRCRSASST